MSLNICYLCSRAVQGGREGDGWFGMKARPHPLPSPPLEGEGMSGPIMNDPQMKEQTKK